MSTTRNQAMRQPRPSWHRARYGGVFAACVLGAFGARAADQTAPVLPPEEAVSPAPEGERPHIRYWLQDPSAPAEPRAEPAAATPEVQPAPAKPPEPRSTAEKPAREQSKAVREYLHQQVCVADDAMRHKDYPRAIAICDSVLAIDPNFIEAGLIRSQCNDRVMAQTERFTNWYAERKVKEAELEAQERAIQPPSRMPETRPYFPRRGDDPAEPKRKKVAQLLEEPVTLDLTRVVTKEGEIKESTLEDALHTLFTVAGISWFADTKALVDADGKPKTVGTMSLQDVPLREVLEFFARTKDVQWSVTEDALWVTPAADSGGGGGGGGGGAGAASAGDLKRIMVLRVYPIHNGLVTSRKNIDDGGAGAKAAQGGGGRGRGGGRARGGGGGGGQQQQQQQKQDEQEEPSYLELVMDWLAEQSDPQTFPDGSKYFIDKPSNQLVVFTTPAGHAKLKEFLDVFDQPPIQVLIKARFIEVSQDASKALGFSLDKMAIGISKDMAAGRVQINPTGGQGIPAPTLSGTVMTVIGARTDPEFQVTLNALANDKNSRILSEPQILAINGKESYLNVTSSFDYVTQYQILYNTQTVFTNGVPTTEQYIAGLQPTSYDSMDLGFKLYVTPSVGRDLKTINLHIKPVIDELGANQTLADFSQLPTVQQDAQGKAILPALKTPVVDQRYLETDVVLDDNGYVIIGGLVRHRTDVVENGIPGLRRIPGLGILFRTTNKTRSTSNLVIIVEAQILTQRGRTYRTEPNADDGDVRQGASNRLPGQALPLGPNGPPVYRGAPPQTFPRPDLLPLIAPPTRPARPATQETGKAGPEAPTMDAERATWRVSEEEK